jgi:hypothetical protein
MGGGLQWLDPSAVKAEDLPTDPLEGAGQGYSSPEGGAEQRPATSPADADPFA